MSLVASLARQSKQLAQTRKQGSYYLSTSAALAHSKTAPDAVKTENPKPKTERYVEFQKKLRAKTPLGKLDEHSRHPFQEQEPLKPWPNNTNPNTGEVGGPSGPEPTRYGDWERKGRVSDF